MHAVLALSLTVALAPTAPPAGDRVKYYEVGRPETLTAVARTVLGDPARAPDLLALNADRVQPGGRHLADLSAPTDAALPAGWTLILPWDATGGQVRYGELPAGPLSPPPAAPSAGAAPAEDPAGGRLILAVLLTLTGLAVAGFAVRRARRIWSARRI